MCAVQAETGFPAALVKAEAAGKRLLTEAADHRDQTGLKKPSC